MGSMPVAQHSETRFGRKESRTIRERKVGLFSRKERKRGLFGITVSSSHVGEDIARDRKSGLQTPRIAEMGGENTRRMGWIVAPE